MLELYIENVLVETSKELQIPLTYQTTDLANPQAIKNDYSKTVQIPGTKSNNNLFGHIFNADQIKYLGTSIVGTSFNANKRAKYTIVDNGSIFSNGYAKLDSISVQNKSITYNLTLYGGIGNFFYNLMYNEDGSEKTLNSLYYGINDYNVNDENTLQLFEYEKQFVFDSWQNRLSNDVNGNDVTKIFCAIPTYSGYYEDFDNNKVIINKIAYQNALAGNRSRMEVQDGETTKVYEDKSNWVLCDMGTDVSEWEIRDIRSHYQRLGMRMRSIYDAIKNPINNGGFEIDDNNVRDIEQQYIDNMYLVFNRFNYEEIGQTSQYIELSGWTHDVTNSYNNKNTISTSSRSVTIEQDTSKWININGQMVITPEWSNRTAWYRKQATTEIDFATTFVRGYNSQRADEPWVTNALYSPKGYATIYSCYQYYWVEIQDKNSRVLSKSPAYMIGMKHSNVGCEELGNYKDGNTILGKAVNNIRSLMESEVKQRNHGNGNVVWSYSDNIWNFPQTTSGDVTTYDFTKLLPISSDKNGMGETRTFTIDLNGLLTNESKKIVLNSCCISYVGAIDVKTGSVSTTPQRQSGNWWSGSIYKSQFYNTALNGTWYQTEGVWFGIASASFFCANPTTLNKDVYPIQELEGKSTGASKIYAGESAAADDSHVLYKRNIFSETKSPYHYLTSLGKMFNWKFIMDRYDNIIHIYSHCNYFKDNVKDINDKLDYKTFSVLPTTSEYNNYNYNLQLVEDTYAANLWNARNSSDYGKLVFNTGYEFNKESKDAIDDVVYSQTVPWNLTSVFFNQEDLSKGREITPFMGAKYFITLWDKTSEEGQSLETKFNGLLFYGKVNQNKKDKTIKLCNFDKEYSDVSTNDLIVLYDSKSSSNQVQGQYYISNNYPVINQLNDNNCYIRSLDKEVELDIMSHRTGVASIITNKIPIFNNHFYNNSDKTYYWINYGIGTSDMSFDKSVKNISLFELCWYNYVNDLYNQNNKKCNIKYRLTEHPYEALRKFYIFDNTLWALNSIKNYNPGYAKFTDCEFIKVQNKMNYLS